jgi:hypothetical protein
VPTALSPLWSLPRLRLSSPLRYGQAKFAQEIPSMNTGVTHGGGSDSGCRAEQYMQRTAKRLTNLIADSSAISRQIFWLTVLILTNSNAVFTDTEFSILDQLADAQQELVRRNVTHYTIAVPKLRGYLTRGNDTPQTTRSCDAACHDSPTISLESISAKHLWVVERWLGGTAPAQPCDRHSLPNPSVSLVFHLNCNVCPSAPDG